MKGVKLIKPVVFESKYKTFKEIEIVSRLIDAFENVLYKNNIYIPDEHRLGEDDEACIFGKTYYELEDKILEILSQYKED